MATAKRWVHYTVPLLMVAHSAKAVMRVTWNRQWDSTASLCAPLVNHGTHSTVEVDIGTPPQAFDLVADTGSSGLVVSSCVCCERGNCIPHSRCFRGLNMSSTFSIDEHHGLGPKMASLNFGSGQMIVAYASDVARVDGVEAKMDNALLLMVDHQLKIHGSFEGILGLGLPRLGAPRYGRPVPMKGFLENAHIQRFSICLTDAASGVLRLNSTMKNSNALGSLGKLHWGLGFEGISVGNSHAPVQFCAKEGSMGPGQKTPCGAIPDSGTTLMMGPASHLRKLYRSICDAWPRCRSRASRMEEDRSNVFPMLLLQCQNWLLDGDGLDELPSLYFHVVGSGGKMQVLEMPAIAYVIQVRREGVQSFIKQAPHTLGGMAYGDSDEAEDFCIPAFGEMDFNSKENGPVWVLGTPFFYQYRVAYDLDATPPAIAFSEAPCGSCPDNIGFLSTRRKSSAWSTMRFHGPPRLPSFSLNQSGVM